MKKVAILVFNNFTHDSRVLREGISLQNAGYDVQIVALHEGDLPKREIKDGLAVERLALRSRFLPKSIFWQIFKWLELFILIAAKYRKVDYFHVCDVLPLPMAVWTKRLFNKKIKIIYDAHELEFMKNTASASYGKLIAWLEDKHLRKADAIITVTELIADEYANHYGIQRPNVIHNFPYLKSPQKKDHFRKRFGIRADQKIVIYQGTIAPNRGCEQLVEAFKDMPDNFVLVFLGYGPFWDKISKLSEGMKNVFMHEAVSMDVLLDYTASADVGAYSVVNTNLSHDFSLGNKIFEYLMSGLPIISADLRGARSFLKEDFTVFVNDFSAASMLKAMQHFEQEDEQKRKEAISAFMKINNWNEEEKKLIRIYQNA